MRRHNLLCRGSQLIIQSPTSGKVAFWVFLIIIYNICAVFKSLCGIIMILWHAKCGSSLQYRSFPDVCVWYKTGVLASWSTMTRQKQRLRRHLKLITTSFIIIPGSGAAPRSSSSSSSSQSRRHCCHAYETRADTWRLHVSVCPSVRLSASFNRLWSWGRR